MFSRLRLTLFLLLIPAISISVFGESLSSHPKLAGILFFKFDCAECIEVINYTIPVAFDESSSDSSILVVNNAQPAGGQLFLEFLISREIPPNSQLPIFISQKEIWSGKEDISGNLTGLLRSHNDLLSLDQFHDKTLVTELLAQKPNQGMPTVFLLNKNTLPQKQSQLDYFYNNYRKDPIGNGIAVIVLVGMICSLGYIFKRFISKSTEAEITLTSLYPFLCLVAMAIAMYLFMSGLMENELSCGPVGECNTVQQSEYSKLFGTIPVSLMGVLAYSTCIIFWLAARFDIGNQRKFFVLSAWICSVVAVCFFVYLTFLEPFVIGATCIWCITSAITTTILALVITKPALAAINT